MAITQCPKIWIFNFQRILQEKPSKTAGINNISVKFLKDGAHVLAQPISQLWTLNAKSLNTVYNGIEIEQYVKLKYLGCILDESLSA